MWHTTGPTDKLTKEAKDKLTDKAIAAWQTPAKERLVNVAPNLYVQMKPTGSRSWLFRYMFRVPDETDPKGKRVPKNMGLGRTDRKTLKAAREEAHEYLCQIAQGNDPHAYRAKKQEDKWQEANPAHPFAKVAAEYMVQNAHLWGKKQRQQWENSLARYASDLNQLDVAAIDTNAVIRIVDPLWLKTPEVAKRTLGRIEAILSYSIVKKYRPETSGNPARYRGHIQHVLKKAGKVEHHPALPWAEIADFMAELSEQNSMGALALRFIVLTAARSGEAIKATWDQINWADRVWTIPGSKMKAGREHRVPLSDAALAVLQAAKVAGDARNKGFVFPGRRRGSCVSDMYVRDILYGLRQVDVASVHGFRSTFADFAAEGTGAPRELREAALAHSLKDRTEAAYQRGDLLERRRMLMDDWAAWCAGQPVRHYPIATATTAKPDKPVDNVVPMRRQRKAG
jgi:integrase